MAKTPKYKPYIIYSIAALAFLVLMLSMISILPPTPGSQGVPNTALTKRTWMNSPNDIINSITQINRIKENLVVIDPGHGGDDPGAIYPYDKSNQTNPQVKEKDLNLDISLKLYQMLRKSGIRVHMTRQDDITLKSDDRGELANHMNAALFVSIHNNSYKENRCPAKHI